MVGLGADRKYEKVSCLRLPCQLKHTNRTTLKSLLTLKLLDAVLDFDIGSVRHGLCRDLFQISLPCSRAIWNAGTNFDWEKGYKKCQANRMSDKPLVVGDLEELRTQPVEAVDPKVTANLSLWAEEMDNFGRPLLNGIVGLRE
jgi:hypothetical protein